LRIAVLEFWQARSQLGCPDLHQAAPVTTAKLSGRTRTMTVLPDFTIAMTDDLRNGAARNDASRLIGEGHETQARATVAAAGP
jgi:hypothetical protein